MTYAVKQLATISGVSVRTLHWYDKRGLLKPSFYGENGYRYYEKEQLLELQQILFFRELGFKLNDIKNLISQKDFDRIGALQSHKKALAEEIAHKNELIATIDKTISHLKGKEVMQDGELYYGFSKTISKDGVYTIECEGIACEAILGKFKKEEVTWSEQQWNDFKNHLDDVDKAIVKLMNNGFAHDSDEVQELIHERYKLQGNFFDLTKEVWGALIELYEAQNPEMKKFFECYHPKMQEFLCKAMRFYGDKTLCNF